MRRLCGVDGVRALAALAVVGHHVASRTTGTIPAFAHPVVSQLWLGVTAFFVLSGFLLFRPFARATLAGETWPSPRSYLRARALRILPAYWLAISAILIVEYHSIFVATLLLGVLGLLTARRLRLLGITIVANSVLLVAVMIVAAPREFVDAGVPILRHYALLQPTTGQLIGPAWSLQVEAAFYLALPVIALVLHDASRRAPTLAARALRLNVGLGTVFVAAVAYEWWTATETGLLALLPGYLALFAAGMALAVAAESGLANPELLRWPLIGAAVCVLAVLLRETGPTITYVGDHHYGPLYRPLMAVGFAALIGSAVLPARSLLLGQVVRLRALEKIGVVSYGIYLWHDPLVLAAARHGLYTGNPMLNTAVTAVAATVIAVASWIVLERRLLALKRPSAPRERTEPLAVSELARTPQVTAA